MTYTAILMPAFALVLLTFALLFHLGAARAQAVKAGLVTDRDGAVLGDERVWPARARQAASAFRNQFELPVLFYVLTAFVLVTRKADILYMVLAWIFVISRYVHAAVHIGPNVIRARFSAYFVGVLALLLMWVLFALAMIFAPIVP